jgi:hypothetical protein
MRQRKETRQISGVGTLAALRVKKGVYTNADALWGDDPAGGETSRTTRVGKGKV